MDNINNLGIFINNTDSQLKLNINEHNYNILNNNFNLTIVYDSENTFSEDLKNKINDNKIYKYTSDNKSPLFFNKIKNLMNDLKDINFENVNYVTFIYDDYIYLNNLANYFKYINDHKLQFYSYSDSTDNIYHYEYYLFSIKANMMDNFIEYISSGDCDDLYSFDKIFINKIPFLKIAYTPGNLDKNIFYNDELYKELFESNLLPIININNLLKIKSNFKYLIFNEIPENFDISIYRSHEDLRELSDDKLFDHFLNYGQFEFRKYSLNEYILPLYIRSKLIDYNLLQFLDLPESCNIYEEIHKNKDLMNLTKKEFILYFIDNIK